MKDPKSLNYSMEPYADSHHCLPQGWPSKQLLSSNSTRRPCEGYLHLVLESITFFAKDGKQKAAEWIWKIMKKTKYEGSVGWKQSSGNRAPLKVSDDESNIVGPLCCRTSEAGLLCSDSRLSQSGWLGAWNPQQAPLLSRAWIRSPHCNKKWELAQIHANSSIALI